MTESLLLVPSGINKFASICHPAGKYNSPQRREQPARATPVVGLSLTGVGHTLWRLGCCCAFAVWLAVAAVPAEGITINAVYDEEERPAFDPDGTRLMGVVNAAVNIWESFYPMSNNSYDLEFSWYDLDDTTMGEWTPELIGTNDLRLDTQLNGVPRNWFFDPTPLVNEEYDIEQTLFSENPTGFTGPPPPVLEVGFRGDAFPSPPGPPNDSFDLLSTVLHEMGHELGINSWNFLEGDMEMSQSHLRGAIARVEGDGWGPATWHLVPPDTLMCGGCGRANLRRLPSVTDILVIAADQGINVVDLPRQEFIAGTDFNTANNWIGGAVPDNDTQVSIRPPGGANVSMSNQAVVESLNLGNNSQLSVGSQTLSVTKTLTVPAGSTLSVGSGVVTADSLALTNTTLAVGPTGLVGTNTTKLIGARINLDTSSLIFDELDLDAVSSLSGSGSIVSSSSLPSTLVNNGGVIEATGGTLRIVGDPAVESLDLDGPSSTGRLRANTGSLLIEGKLVGEFQNTLTVGADKSATFDHGWTLGQNGEVALDGAPGAPARLDGGLFASSTHTELKGSLVVTGDAEIAADVHLAANSRVALINSATILQLTGQTRYEAGQIQGAGTLRQTGDATVGRQPGHWDGTTEITVGVFDMDGTAESLSDVEIFSDAALRVDATQIEMGNPALDGYDGRLRVRGELQINTAAPWRLDGEMQLEAGATLVGSPLSLYGSINTNLGTNGEASITAPLNLQQGYQIYVGNTADTLSLGGTTTVEGPGTVVGWGQLRQTGNLVLNQSLTIPAGMAYDWDGQESSPSTTLVNPGSVLTLNAHTLEPGGDGYDGTISLDNSTLEVNTPGGWQLDGNLNMVAAQLTGSGTVAVNGDIQTSGATQINAPLQLHPGAVLTVASDTTLLQQLIEYAGGNLVGGSSAGQARQQADATVSGNSQINIDIYDWDGLETSPTTTRLLPGSSLTLNVKNIDPDNAQFDGAISVVGGQLQVNTSAHWRLAGQIEVGSAGSMSGSVGGSPLTNAGTIAALGSGSIEADLYLTQQGVLRVDDPTDTLSLSGETTYDNLTAVTGQGTIVQNGNAQVIGPATVDVGTFDLDGNELAPSDVTILFTSGPFGPDDAFVIDADRIDRSDPAQDGFDGTLRLTQHVLEVNTTDAWRLDGRLELISVGGNFPRVQGSDLTVHGTIDTVGEARLAVGTHFKPTAAVQLDAGEVLHLDNRVTYEGGSYTGQGTLEHNLDTKVISDTTINVATFDMDGASEGATMTVAQGSLNLHVDRLDTSDNVFDGQLAVAAILFVNTPTAWTTTGTVELQPSGTIAGAPLVNEGTIFGAGNIKTDALTNNGGIFAESGTLTLRSAILDLDGTSDNSPIEAVLGDLLVDHPPLSFAGQATVGTGHTLTFRKGFSAQGTLLLQGPTQGTTRATLAGGLARFDAGHVTRVSGQAEITAPSEFQLGSQVEAPLTTDILFLTGDAKLFAGSGFVGQGQLVNQAAATLTADDEAKIELSLTNEGLFEIGAPIGRVVVWNFQNRPGGELALDINGLTPGDDYDQLSVKNKASLDGHLSLEPLTGYSELTTRGTSETFSLLMANGIVGTFDTIDYDEQLLLADFGPDPNGSFRDHVGNGRFRNISYTSTSVELTNYLAWSGDANGDGLVDADDFAILTDHWLSSVTGGWVEADFDGSGVVGPSDLALLANNWAICGGACPARVSGDFNYDGMVDAADYTLWQDNLGLDAAVLSGNGSGAATVVQADYQLWRSHFGESIVSGSAAVPVPEPTTLLLALLGLAAAPLRVRRG